MPHYSILKKELKSYINKTAFSLRLNSKEIRSPQIFPAQFLSGSGSGGRISCSHGAESTSSCGCLHYRTVLASGSPGCRSWGMLCRICSLVNKLVWGNPTLMGPVLLPQGPSHTQQKSQAGRGLWAGVQALLRSCFSSKPLRGNPPKRGKSGKTFPA